MIVPCNGAGTVEATVDEIWEAFLAVALPFGEVREQRSRYADKPAAVLGAREIAHSEAPGHIDLRITRQRG